MKTTEEKEEQFNEIIFENRNKDYGAYSIRKSYKKRMLIATSITLTAFLIAVSFPLIAAYFDDGPKPVILDSLVYEPIRIDPNDQPKLPTPPPPPKKSVDINNLKISNDKTLIDEKQEDIFGTLENVENSPVPGPEEFIPKDLEPDVKPQIIDENKVFELPDIQELPTYPGGDEAWMTIVAENVHYPVIAIESGTSGTVFVRFVIEPDGSISNISSVRPLGAGCDEEAIRVVKMLSKWNPGKQNGKAVRVWLTLPIKFILQ